MFNITWSTADIVLLVILVIMVVIGFFAWVLDETTIRTRISNLYLKFWYKRNAKNHVLENTKWIDELSRKSKKYNPSTVYLKPIIAASEGRHLSVLTQPQHVKQKEQTIQTCQYILRVIEKYPLLPEVKKELLAELLYHLYWEFPFDTTTVDLEKFNFSFNRFVITSATFHKSSKPTKPDTFNPCLLDVKANTQYNLNFSMDYAEGKKLCRTFAEVLLRTEDISRFVVASAPDASDTNKSKVTPKKAASLHSQTCI